MPKNDIQMWMGTEEYMRWFPVPASGANVSPEGWGESGALLGGGGFAQQSWDSHKNYQFAWSGASTRQIAQAMHSLRDGSFGRGLIYFHDPLTYSTNVLPKRWADPSMAVREPSATLVYNAAATDTPTSSPEQNGLPVRSASYAISALPTTVSAATSLFIPIPPGYVLALGAFYSAAATAGVYATIVDSNGNNGATNRLTPQLTTATNVVSNYATGVRGVRLWLGRVSGTTGSLILSGMIARLFKSSNSAEEPPPAGWGALPYLAYAGYRQTQVLTEPWIGGQGHSGCRFEGEPTYVNNTGVDGGQVGFAASFREVGSWARG